jgi:hypothetical protein
MSSVKSHFYCRKSGQAEKKANPCGSVSSAKQNTLSIFDKGVLFLAQVSLALSPCLPAVPEVGLLRPLEYLFAWDHDPQQEVDEQARHAFHGCAAQTSCNGAVLACLHGRRRLWGWVRTFTSRLIRPLNSFSATSKS